jgi:hypothetical protein
MGIGVTNGWVFVDPRLQGYSAGVGTLPDEDLTIVVFSTLTPASDPDRNHGSELFVRLATLLSPDQPPMMPGS